MSEEQKKEAIEKNRDFFINEYGIPTPSDNPNMYRTDRFLNDFFARNNAEFDENLKVDKGGDKK